MSKKAPDLAVSEYHIPHLTPPTEEVPLLVTLQTFIW
jgi:hypothetical protein